MELNRQIRAAKERIFRRGVIEERSRCCDVMIEACFRTAERARKILGSVKILLQPNARIIDPNHSQFPNFSRPNILMPPSPSRSERPFTPDEKEKILRDKSKDLLTEWLGWTEWHFAELLKLARTRGASVGNNPIWRACSEAKATIDGVLAVKLGPSDKDLFDSWLLMATGEREGETEAKFPEWVQERRLHETLPGELAKRFDGEITAKLLQLADDALVQESPSLLLNSPRAQQVAQATTTQESDGRGMLYPARMAKRRKEQLEEQLRNTVRTQNLFGSLIAPERHAEIDANREVVLPAIDQLEQEKKAKQSAAIGVPPLGPSSISLSRLSRLPINILRPESRQEVLKRVRKKRRNTKLESWKFDEEIGKKLHEARQKLRDCGHKSKRPRRTPTLPRDQFEKIVKAADAEKNGKRLYPLKDVLPKKVWEQIAGHNSSLGGSKPKLSTFTQLFAHRVFKNVIRARFNRAATYYRKIFAPARAGV